MPTKPKKPAASRNRPRTHRILLVEDDTFLSGMYITKLTLAKFDVTLATNGTEALSLVKQTSPSLILLDVRLPKLDGFGVLRVLKKDRQLAKIPVILLTNLSDQDSIDRAQTFQVADYLIKAHYRPAEVVDKVRQILKKQPKG